MITIQSSPLIFDEELGSFLEPFGKIAAIVQKPYSFAQHIDSGLRQIFLTLHEDVKATDIPRSLCTSNGVWRKLSFKGKPYNCQDCGTKHTKTESCPTPQHDNHDQQQNCSTSQDNSPEDNSRRTDTTQQTRDHTNAQQTPLLPKTRTAYNKNLQQSIPDVIGHTHPYMNIQIQTNNLTIPPNSILAETIGC